MKRNIRIFACLLLAAVLALSPAAVFAEDTDLSEIPDYTITSSQSTDVLSEIDCGQAPDGESPVTELSDADISQANNTETEADIDTANSSSESGNAENTAKTNTAENPDAEITEIVAADSSDSEITEVATDERSETTEESELTADIQASSPGIVTDPTGKKGIIAADWLHGTNAQDPIELGIDHVLFNIYMQDVVCSSGINSFQYGGNTYNFGNSNLKFYRDMLLGLRNKGITITIQINMGWSSDSTVQSYIYPPARQSGHSLYALDTSSAAARTKLSAAFHFLVEYMDYVNNWIVGCEVNSPWMGYYSGTNAIDTNTTLMAQAFDIMSQAIADVGTGAKNYVCLDNIWNFDNGLSIPARDYLKMFASKVSDQNWNVAYHPYPVPYDTNSDDPTQWELWDKKEVDFGTSHKEDTSFITGANLEVLTNYIYNNYGGNHRVILTEFGYDSRAGEASQAAQLYYTYKAAERNSMIDACIYQPYKDTGWDGRTMGLVDSNFTKRKIFNVFKYMDQDSTKAGESSYLSLIGISSWNRDILYGNINKALPANANASVEIKTVDGKNYIYLDGEKYTSAGTPVLQGNKYYVSSGGSLKTGWLYLGNWKMYFDPATYAAATGFKEIDGKMYLFNKDGVMQNYAGTTNIEVNGKTGKYWFSTDDASLKTGWLSLGSMKLYFDPDTYAAYVNCVREIDGKRYAFNGNGVMYTNSTPVVNGKKYYCTSDGTLRSGWLYLGMWKMYFDTSTYAAATGFKEIDGKMYLFDANGVMQNYAGTTNITVNGVTNKYWFSTDDASLKTGWLTLGNLKLYFDPETYAAYVNTTKTIDNVTYTFDANGVATAA